MIGKMTFLFPVEGIKATVRRFPLSALCAAALFVVTVLSIHDYIDNMSETLSRIIMALGFGYLWFGAARLLAESKGWGDLKYSALAMPVFAGIAVWVILADNVLFMAFVFPAAMLFISVAAYLGVRDNLSLWFFNQQIWFGVAISILAGVIWGGGISAALASIDYLFDVKIEGEVYSDLWAFAMLIFAPLYALSWVPEKFIYREEDCTAPQQLSFMLNWVMAPLLLIYMVILYAYFIKIAIVQEIPRGQLSYMITGFGAVGIATFLSGWPLRQAGAMPVRALFRVFFPGLIIPAAMLFIAIAERIGQYGVTEQRYAVVMAGLWFMLSALVFTIGQAMKREMPMQIIVLLLAALLLVSSAGPWGAVHVSGASQMARLEKVLAQYGALQDGKAVAAAQEIPFEEKKNITSIIDYMYGSKRLKEMQAVFGKAPYESSYDNVFWATKIIGFERVGMYESAVAEDRFSIEAQDSLSRGPVDVRGYDWGFYNHNVYCGHCKEETPIISAVGEVGRPGIDISKGENLALVLKSEGYPELRFDVPGEIAAAIKRSGRNELKEPVVITQESGGVRAKLIVQSASGSLFKDGAVKVENIGFDLLLSYPENTSP